LFNKTNLIDRDGNVHLAIADATELLSLDHFKVEKLLKNSIIRGIK